MFTEKQLLYKIIRNIAQILIFFVIFAVIIGILSRQIFRVSNSVSENERLTLILQTRNENLGILKDEMKSIGNIDQTIAAAFPNTDTILNFVGDMETLALKHSMRQNFRFGNTTPVPSSPEFSLSTIDFSLTLTGNITYLNNYLKEFEKLPYFAKVTSINIASQNGWLNDSQITLGGKLYLKLN